MLRFGADHRENRFSGVQCRVMKFLKLAVVCAFAALALDAAEGNGDGRCGGGTPPTAATITVSNSTTGTFSVAMSTSFQPAEWDYQFFTQSNSHDDPG